MALTFSDKPVVHYGNQRRSTLDEIRERFPAEMRGMDTAPSMGSTPVWTFEANGQPFYAIHHRGQWQKMAYEVDNRSGQTRWRMVGEAVSNPVGWLPATRENVKP
jgi:hypothetical protein